MIAVPLYSDIASLHDHVVQAEGAFDETIRGLMNLARFGQRIELRIVLHKLTVDRLPEFAEFVARNLPFVDHVALMGLELMGYTKMNMDALWIDPVDYQPSLRDAVKILVSGKVTPIIFNHQLCLLDRSLWPFSAKSISDWKNEYVDACGTCSVKRDCGGFFASGITKHSRAIQPIAEMQPATQGL
jgi:His-Xaa-Ser system radical SAM maturase HxsC